MAVAHHECHTHYLTHIGYAVYRNEYFLIVKGCRVVTLSDYTLTNADFDAFGCLIGEDSADDAGDKNHDYHTIEYCSTHEWFASSRDDEVSAHKHHCQGSCCVGFGKPEEHKSLRTTPAEQMTGDDGRDVFRHCTCYNHDDNDEQGTAFLEKRTRIDQHSDTYKEVWNEDGFCHEFQTVHQW